MEPRAAIVFGAGASGRAAARALLRRGAEVAVAVREPDGATAALAAEGAAILAGDPAASVAGWGPRHAGADAVFSPGIPPSAPEFAAARAAGLRVRGELCLGCGLFGGRVVAITGSKGKSSVAKLLADALSANGTPAVPCGNYGTPVCEIADLRPAPAVAVAECSSFQLETADEALAPEAAAVLNLSRDHLNRHGTMEAYLEAKLRIFDLLASGGLALVPAPADDPGGVLARAAALHPALRFATFGAAPDAEWRWTPGEVRGPGGERLAVAGSYFDNDVLGPAAACAAAILLRLGLAPEAAAAAIRGFAPLPHRMQRVAEGRGAVWIDNSKATSLAAMLASVRMAPKPALLVAGGRIKEDLSVRGVALASLGVAKAYTIGECGEAMARAWSGALPVEFAGDLGRACEAAARDVDALRPACVLLAPGTASFDQFRSFEERGDRFAALARRLADGPATA